MKAYENEYFTFIETVKDERLYFDLMRKRPTVPGAYVELLELLSVPMLDNSNCAILIPTEDNYLLKDLQMIGFTVEGYLVENIDSSKTYSWDGDQPECIIDFSNIEILAESKVLRLVLSASGTLCHPINFGALENINFFRKRERYLNGLTEFFYDPKSNKEESRSNFNPKKRNVKLFEEIISKRISASSFKRKLEDSELLNVLNDTFAWTTNGSRPFPSAGGLSAFTVYILNGNKKYIYNSKSNTLDTTDFYLDKSTLFELGGEISMFRGCETWAAITFDINIISEKYATRSYRFAMIETGAILQQMHLSCASFGFDGRILGGFDDALVEKLLKLRSHHMITALFGMGG
jgi:SagB-type dehydrogenase family enzyme